MVKPKVFFDIFDFSIVETDILFDLIRDYEVHNRTIIPMYISEIENESTREMLKAHDIPDEFNLYVWW